jgi:hypothetical protein
VQNSRFTASLQRGRRVVSTVTSARTRP